MIAMPTETGCGRCRLDLKRPGHFCAVTLLTFLCGVALGYCIVSRSLDTRRQFFPDNMAQHELQSNQ